MKKIFILLALVLTALLFTASFVNAHHSFAMFDKTIEKVATGQVVRWTFNNPHSWLYINVKNPDGTETLWSFPACRKPPELHSERAQQKLVAKSSAY